MSVFFSSRRRHTRYWRDWSSDVCSSDLNGRTITFAVDGVEYEIDLAEQQAEKFAEALETYVAHARRIGGRRASATPNRASKTQRDYDPRAVREWAKSNKIELPPRGRIPADVIPK